MRKRNATHVIKTLFWYFIYALPLILYLIWTVKLLGNDSFVLNAFDNDGDLSVLWQKMDFYMFMQSFSDWNPISTIFVDLFSDTGILFLFDGTFGYALTLYFSYLVFAHLAHLCIDFLLFIPRLTHKWMSGITGTDEGE